MCSFYPFYNFQDDFVFNPKEDKLLDDMKKNDGNIEAIVYAASKRHNCTWAKNRIHMAYNASRVEARVCYMKMYLSTNFLEEVPHIKVPIKIILGKYDFPIFSFKTLTRLFSPYYQDIEIIECQEAGHYPMLECPVYFASYIEKFCS